MFVFFHTYVGLCMTALFFRYVFMESFSDASQNHLGLDIQFPKLAKLVASHYFAGTSFNNSYQRLETLVIFQLKFFQGQ